MRDRDVRENDPCAFPAVPLLFLFCPLWYLTGSLMIPFGVFETSGSEIDSPHARAVRCAVSLGATATYRLTSSGQRHAMGVRLGRISVPPSSCIYRAVLILRRRVRLALLGSQLSDSNFSPHYLTTIWLQTRISCRKWRIHAGRCLRCRPSRTSPEGGAATSRPKGRASPLASFGSPVISRLTPFVIGGIHRWVGDLEETFTVASYVKAPLRGRV